MIHLKSYLKKTLRSIGFFLLQDTQSQIRTQFSSIHKATQLSLILRYRHLIASRQLDPSVMLPSLDEVELRCHSQNGEDGILLYIFAIIGTTNKKVVEVCAGNGIECNAANLIIHHGWYGLLIDGNEKLINEAKKFYATCQDTRGFPPFVKKAWITKDNINQIIGEEYGFQGEIDLFSLDMDGVDYWILQELTVVSPRVIVLEYANIWHTEKAVTIPYENDFSYGKSGHNYDFCGASLSAFVQLLGKKGYRYVGSQSLGFNAFFIRKGIGEEYLPEVTPDAIFKTPKVQYCTKDRLVAVKHLPWVEL